MLGPKTDADLEPQSKSQKKPAKTNVEAIKKAEIKKENDEKAGNKSLKILTSEFLAIILIFSRKESSHDFGRYEKSEFPRTRRKL